MDARLFVCDHQRFVDEKAELVENLELLGLAGRGDRARGVEVESVHEHTESAKQDLLGFGQQRVRPVHRGPQRLLASHGVSGATRQKTESVVKAVGDLPQRQRAHTCRSQFDRKGHSVESLADISHQIDVVAGSVESGPRALGAVGEQRDGLVVQRKRGDAPGDLT